MKPHENRGKGIHNALIAHFFKKEVSARKIEKRSGFAPGKATCRKISEERTSKCPKRFGFRQFWQFTADAEMAQRSNQGLISLDNCALQY
jgi:hypothetical protein